MSAEAMKFGWKRKLNERLVSGVAFRDDNQQDGNSFDLTERFSCLEAAKRRKMHLLEDREAKSNRLKDEGNLLAEEERYWEAIKRWDEAIQLTPGSAVLHELKSQALLILNELYPAVEAAERTVRLDPRWGVAYQTLGRAQLGLGEIQMAVRSFAKAVHLDPLNKEVWEEDLPWARELMQKKIELEKEKRESKRASENGKDYSDRPVTSPDVKHYENKTTSHKCQ